MNNTNNNKADAIMVFEIIRSNENDFLRSAANPTTEKDIHVDSEINIEAKRHEFRTLREQDRSQGISFHEFVALSEKIYGTSYGTQLFHARLTDPDSRLPSGGRFGSHAVADCDNISSTNTVNHILFITYKISHVFSICQTTRA